MPRGYEIFPNTSDEVDPQDILPGPRGYNVRPCNICGAAVLISRLQTHMIWHDMMDELIEWAQEVSNNAIK